MKTIALTGGGGSAGHIVPHLSMPSTRHGAKVVFASFYLTSNVLQVIISKKSNTNYT